MDYTQGEDIRLLQSGRKITNGRYRAARWVLYLSTPGVYLEITRTDQVFLTIIAAIILLVGLYAGLLHFLSIPESP